jgi:hypothetical protein
VQHLKKPIDPPLTPAWSIDGHLGGSMAFKADMFRVTVAADREKLTEYSITYI